MNGPRLDYINETQTEICFPRLTQPVCLYLALRHYFSIFPMCSTSLDQALNPSKSQIPPSLFPVIFPPTKQSHFQPVIAHPRTAYLRQYLHFRRHIATQLSRESYLPNNSSFSLSLSRDKPFSAHGQPPQLPHLFAFHFFPFFHFFLSFLEKKNIKKIKKRK